MSKKTETKPPETPEPDKPPEPAEHPQEEGQLIIDGTLSAMGRPRYRGEAIFATVDVSKPEGKAAVFNAVSGSSTPLRDAAGQVIRLVGFIAVRGQIQTDDADETRLGVKLLLLDDKGNRYFSTAQSVLQALDRVIQFFGPGPWKPPIEVVFTKSTTANNRPWWNVELA